LPIEFFEANKAYTKALVSLAETFYGLLKKLLTFVAGSLLRHNGVITGVSLLTFYRLP
jgi:hypothetical protein